MLAIYFPHLLRILEKSTKVFRIYFTMSKYHKFFLLVTLLSVIFPSNVFAVIEHPVRVNLFSKGVNKCEVAVKGAYQVVDGNTNRILKKNE